MRWIVLIVLLLAAAWWLRSCERPEPKPIEETVLREPAAALERAEALEQDMQEMTRQRQQAIEQQLEAAEDDG